MSHPSPLPHSTHCSQVDHKSSALGTRAQGECRQHMCILELHDQEMPAPWLHKDVSTSFYLGELRLTEGVRYGNICLGLYEGENKLVGEHGEGNF